jgi:hypothetical protein
MKAMLEDNPSSSSGEQGKFGTVAPHASQQARCVSDVSDHFVAVLHRSVWSDAGVRGEGEAKRSSSPRR